MITLDTAFKLMLAKVNQTPGEPIDEYDVYVAVSRSLTQVESNITAQEADRLTSFSDDVEFPLAIGLSCRYVDQSMICTKYHAIVLSVCLGNDPDSLVTIGFCCGYSNFGEPEFFWPELKRDDNSCAKWYKAYSKWANTMSQKKIQTTRQEAEAWVKSNSHLAKKVGV